MQITQIHAREVYDSRGLPTVACDLCLQDGTWVSSMVPSGASVGIHEALELRDGGTRLQGKGVLKAVEHIYKNIAPQFVGRDINAIDMDQELLALDSSAQKSVLGANATLAVSMALFRAHAQALGIELYDFIARSLDYDEMSMPIPMFNVLNGGRHAQNGLSVQEYLLIPSGARSFEQAMEMSAEVFHILKTLLRNKGKSIATGDEGGFAPTFANSREPLEFLLSAMQKAGVAQHMTIGLDVAASEFYDAERKIYKLDGKLLSGADLIAWYVELVNDFPIISLEDPLAQDDWATWGALKRLLGKVVHVVGDDLLVTNIDRIVYAIEHDAANAVIIKPNQIGTVSEAIAAVLQAQEAGWQVVASHRSGETTDTFIADFALGVRANYVKFGGFLHGERLAKYNRLLQIEFFKNLSR